jgi:hypothetical protein
MVFPSSTSSQQEYLSLPGGRYSRKLAKSFTSTFIVRSAISHISFDLYQILEQFSIKVNLQKSAAPPKLRNADCGMRIEKENQKNPHFAIRNPN